MNDTKYPKLAKKASDGTYCFLVQRWLSAYTTGYCLRIGLSANSATIIDFILALFASLFLYLGYSIAGVVFIQLFGVWSCVDGEIARFTKTASKLGVFEGENKSHFSDDFSKIMYQSFLNDEINVILPGGGENLKMVDMRIAQPVIIFLEAVENLGHTLVVGHRNINEMIIKNLLGLSFDEGYRVEHENNCLYVYAPKVHKIFLIKICNPNTTIEIVS